MAEDDAGGFEAELLPQLGGGVVAQLMRVPGVVPLPFAELLSLPGRQPLSPLPAGFVIALGRRRWSRMKAASSSSWRACILAAAAGVVSS